ncbi:MAG: hypothetical protein V2B18_19785 [Pseudomonadota bacterium]
MEKKKGRTGAKSPGVKKPKVEKAPMRNVIPFPGMWEEVEPPPLPKFTVGVDLVVSGKQPILKKVESYLKRGLKKLPDVVLTDSKPLYWINVVCLTDAYNGYHIAYFIAATSALKNLITGVFDDESFDMINEFFSDLVYVYEQRLKIGPSNLLKSACDEIVEDFQLNHVEEIREIWETVLNNPWTDDDDDIPF